LLRHTWYRGYGVGMRNAINDHIALVEAVLLAALDEWH
jgi:hypothetical protein